VRDRLEAATARLEDIATSTIELPQSVPALQQSLASPKSAASAASTPVPTSAPKLPPEPVPESIEEFDSFIENSVGKYVKLSKAIGGLVAEQANKFLQGFQAQRTFLLITTKAKKPDLTGSEMSVYQTLLKPINEALMAVTNIKESNRGAPVFHNLSAVAEGSMVLAWVTVDNRPWKHVDESLGSAQFFGNRVLKENKDK
jgi:adenylyl cyclase-associated protein